MAKEYIERESLKAKKVYSIERHEYVVPVAEIDWQPTADVVEVVHGEWLPYKSDESYGSTYEKVWYKCSICGKDALGRVSEDEWYSSPILSNYCQNCGAKMDGGKE